MDEHMVTFTYVDPGLTTDSELRAWGVAHAPLWAALRARTFAVHVVAVGTGNTAADRAEPVLKRWTRAGTGPAETPPAGPTQADPDIRQEITWLKKAITDGNREPMLAGRRVPQGGRASQTLATTSRRHAHQSAAARRD